MDFLEANVAIKVDDKQLPTQLAKVKSVVTRTVDKIKTSFNRMAASFKAAFDKMVKIAKWGALIIAGGLALASRAAMRQEDAIFGLVAALKVAGEYTSQVVKRLTDFASAMQRVTIFGDEATIEQMAYASALGVSADKMEEAMKAAMGLAVITKSLETATMLVARAAGGQTQMLTRYGIMLDETLSPQEKFQALLEKGAALFDLATAKAETTSGALRQMWNAIGDVSEVIGAALLPGIQKAAKAIKEWAEENQERVGRWAEIVVAYITYVKDVFASLIKFMGSDFQMALHYVLNVSIELFKGFGESIVIVMGHAFDKILAVTETKLIGGLTDKIDWAIAYMQKKWEMGILYMTPGQREAARAYADEIVAGLQETRSMKIEPTIEALGPQLQKAISETAKAIRELAPPELVADFEKAGKRLADTIAEIRGEAEAPGFFGAIVDQAESYYGTVKDTLAGGWQLYEDHVVSVAQTQKATEKEAIESAEQVLETMRHMYDKTTGEKIQYLEDHLEAYRETTGEILEIETMLTEEIDRLKRSNVDQMAVYLDELREKFDDTMKWVADHAATAARRIQNSMGRVFYNMMTTSENCWKQFRRIFDEIGKAFAQMVADMIAEWLMFQAITGIGGFLGGGLGGLLGGFGGIFEGLFGGGGKKSGSWGGGGSEKARFTGLQHGGTVTETGWAKVHKGETYSGAGGDYSKLATINIYNYAAGVTIETEEDEAERVVNIVVTALPVDGPLRTGIASVRS